jgi:hypothetical protein
LGGEKGAIGGKGLPWKVLGGEIGVIDGDGLPWKGLGADAEGGEKMMKGELPWT